MKAWLELARISNLPTTWTNVTAAWCLAGGWFGASWWICLFAASAMYIGGMILNDAVDVRFDHKHRPERPIPSGRVSLKLAWIVGLSLLVLGAWVFILGAGANSKWVMALAAAILVYDFYHKPWSGSVWVMGACRTFLYLVVASALTLSFSQEMVFRAVVLGTYIVGLTLIARSESGETGQSGIMGKVGVLGLFLPALLSLYQWGTTWNSGVSPLTMAAGVTVLVVFVAWVIRALKVMKTLPKSNIGRSVGLLLAGVVLVDALALVDTQPLLSLGFILITPLLLVWQRKIAAT